MEQSSKQTILVVEDDAALQEAVKLKLKKAGYNVLVTTTGEEAFAILQKEIPALIWLDILLPGMSGLDLLEKIRKDLRLQFIPVVVVSVSGSDEKKKEAERLHALDYIVKSDSPLDSIVKRVTKFVPI